MARRDGRGQAVRKGGAALPNLFTLIVLVFAAAIAIAVWAGRQGGPEAVAAGQARATGFPELTGRVVDAAGLIDEATEAAITSRLEAFEARSSDQIVVVTIDSLEGAVLEDYANRLFRYWGLGQAGENNGVLLLVARSDRKIRIEVGYGLEGILTDALARLIIENALVPAFRAGDYSRGIDEGTGLIVQVLSGDTAELEARARRNGDRADEPVNWFGIVFAIFWFGFVLSIVGFSLLAPVFGRKTGKNRYKWLGIETTTGGSGRSGSSGGHSGGFSGGGGSSGGGGASGSW